MKRGILYALLAALAVLVTMPQAQAASDAVTMSQPRMIDATTAELSGIAGSRSVVTIQELAPTGQHWKQYRWVRSNVFGQYSVTVDATATPVQYRAVANGTVSEPQTVVAEQPAVEPESAPPVLPAEPAAPTDGCGERPQKQDGSYWSCTVVDDFDGTELDRSLWRPVTGFLNGNAPTQPCYVDDPAVLSVQDGTLRLGARRAETPARCAGTRSTDVREYVAGGVDTHRLFSQQYGRFEARYKSTATTEVGLHEAFWLWPDDRYNTAVWPAAGEIDIAETYSQHPDLVVPFLHYTWYDNGGPVPGLNTAWNCVAKRGEFNTFTLEWTASRLEVLVNGKTCLVNTSADAAFQKPYIMALTQLMGVGANTYDGRAPLPATMTVDYVKVWS